MTAEELIELLEERPFRPLRLYLADGRTREIRHPEMAIVAQDSVAIGIPADDQSRIALRITHCSLPNIVEIEPLEPNGQSGGAEQRRPRRGRGR